MALVAPPSRSIEQPEPSAAAAGSERIEGGKSSGRRLKAPGGATALMALFGGLLAVQGSGRLADNSFLTHLATGRLIIHGGLPHNNPFLFTGTTFPVPSYLWSIVLAVAEALFGATGIRLLTSVTAGLLGMLVVRLAVTREGDEFLGERQAPGLLPVFATVAMTWFCLISFISSRPHLPGFVLLALTVLVWKERRSAWLLLPIFAVWVNVHGTWLYGLGVLGLFAVAEMIDVRKVTRKGVAMIAASMVGTLLGGALYPDRFAVMLLPTRQFGDPNEREALMLYREWRHVQISDPQMWLLMGVALIAIYGCVRNRRYAMTVAAALLVVVGFSSYRLIPIASVALVPLASLGLEGVGSLKLPSGRSAIAMGCVGFALALVAGVSAFSRPSYDLERYPVEAVDWLDARNLVGGEIRTVSHDYVGNYIEWRYGNDANVYVDDRPDAGTFIDYVAMLRLSPGWQDALKRAGGDVIIWKTKEPLVAELESDPGWVKARTSGEFTVFCSTRIAARCG